LAIGSTNENFYVFGGTFMRNFYILLNLDSTINSQELLSTATKPSITLAVSIYASPGNSIIYNKPRLEVFGIAWQWWIFIAISGIILIVIAILIARYFFLRKPSYFKALEKPEQASSQVSVKDKESGLIGS
jgi:hypothetical protein